MNRTGQIIGDSPSLNLKAKRLLLAQTWAEEYTSGKTLIRVEQTVITRDNDPVTGENSGTITYTNCDGSTDTYVQAHGGTWKQKDGSGNPTTPIPYAYC